MNGLRADANQFQAMIDRITPKQFVRHDVLICPPATLLAGFAAIANSTGMLVGGEDCHPQLFGAHTGDISAQMIADAGGKYCIVGHSERRADHGETNCLVKQKAEAVVAAKMIAIVCVGETLAQRQSGNAKQVVEEQIEKSLPKGAMAENCVIAYEPVWAIGTGETASLEDIEQMHSTIRTLLHRLGGGSLAQARILYGGSVKPANAAEIFAITDVDGGLIGGAALKADDFCAIVDGAG